MPEITVTVTRNDTPKVVCTNWDNFEANRDRRIARIIDTIDAMHFRALTAARIAVGMNRKNVKNGA
jgi:hypothetical protein